MAAWSREGWPTRVRYWYGRAPRWVWACARVRCVRSFRSLSSFDRSRRSRSKLTRPTSLVRTSVINTALRVDCIRCWCSDTTAGYPRSDLDSSEREVSPTPISRNYMYLFVKLTSGSCARQCWWGIQNVPRVRGHPRRGFQQTPLKGFEAMTQYQPRDLKRLANALYSPRNADSRSDDALTRVRVTPTRAPQTVRER